MGKWTEYTKKEALKDNDELMILDTDGKANKRTLMHNVWDYVVDKMTSAVIAKLTTTDKTIIGALNELNSKSFTPKYLYYDSITLNEEGFLLIGDTAKNDEITRAKSIEIAYYSSITPQSAINVYGDNLKNCYVFGTPNTVIKGLKIKYFI